MTQRRKLSEMVESAKKAKFSLPSNVTSEKTLLPSGQLAYIFRHDQLGQIGRLLFLPHPNGQTQCAFEISGEVDDQMTQKRREIFEPIAKEISRTMEMACGAGSGIPKPYQVEKEAVQVRFKVMPCETCGKPAAVMVIADDANSPDQLEDYARISFSKIKGLNAPTWVVGEENEVVVNGEYAGESLVLKCWPIKEKAKIMYSTELNPLFDELINTHCS